MLMLMCTSCCISMQFSEPNFGGRDSKTAHKKVTITILPRNQKLTEDKTKWDSAHQFGTASTAQYKK